MSDDHEEPVDSTDDDPENWKPGSFGFHELLDRERLVADLWYDKIASHPSVKQDEKIGQLVDQIGDLLEELYQRIGTVDYFGDENRPRLTPPTPRDS